MDYKTFENHSEFRLERSSVFSLPTNRYIYIYICICIILLWARIVLPEKRHLNSRPRHVYYAIIYFVIRLRAVIVQTANARGYIPTCGPYKSGAMRRERSDVRAFRRVQRRQWCRSEKLPAVSTPPQQYGRREKNLRRR